MEIPKFKLYSKISQLHCRRLVRLNETLSLAHSGNITFHREFEKYRYQRIVRACSLLEDVKTLKGGHECEIGEQGINLSGGQKARVSLARACYSGASVVMLDDPLAAVDPQVRCRVCLCR